MDDQDGISNGIDFKIPIATSGKFVFPLKPAKTINVVDYFGPSGTTTDSDIFDQRIAKVTSSDRALGYFAERKVHAMSAEVFIRTAFSSYGTI